MQQPSIDIAPLFKFSFYQYKQYSSFIIGITVTYFVLAVVPQVYIMAYATQEPTQESQILSGIFAVAQLFISLGFIKIMLRLVDDHYVGIKDLFNNLLPFLSYFIAYFLYTIAIILGLLLFIIPGIFIAVRFLFYPYFILEGTHSSILALQKSYRLTKGLEWELFLFGLAVIALNIAGALFFGIGIIFTYPLTTMATAILFRSLQSESGSLPSKQYRV
ncbi:MAG TPA: hypothetical protein VK074_10065 [Fodinibius sp.]|nr:hypothetical protein [Fodinibius sp.]